MAYAMAEEHQLRKFGGTYNGAMEDAIATRWKNPQGGEKVQGTATPAADPAASLMKQRSKSNDNLEPWHTPSRWQYELHDLEDELQGAVTPEADQKGT